MRRKIIIIFVVNIIVPLLKIIELVLHTMCIVIDIFVSFPLKIVSMLKIIELVLDTMCIVLDIFVSFSLKIVSMFNII